MEDDVKILWEHDGYRLVRIGTEDDGFTDFQSALWGDDMKIVDWQSLKASQIGMLLSTLGEWFDYQDRGLTKVEIQRTVLSGPGWKATVKTKEFDE